MDRFKSIRIITLILSLCLIIIMPVWSETEKTSKIDVVMDNNYPPFVFYDSDHHLKGILIDEWALFQEITGIKVNIHAMDWSAAQTRMENGEYDVIDTLFKNPEREALYDFTKPYADIEVSIFFHKNITGINTIDSVKGFAVAAKRGDQAVNVLMDAGVENITLYDSYEDIVKAAVNNEVVIFIIDNPPARYFLYKYGLQNTFNHTASLYTGQFHRAVKKGNTNLISILESGFSKITPFEEQAILDKWYGKSDYFIETLTKYIQIGFVSIAIIMLGLLAWNATLRLSVRKKTFALSEAVNQLSYNKSKLQAIIASMPDMVFILSHDGVVLDFLTPNMESSLLTSPSDFVGHTLDGYFDSALNKRFNLAIKQVIETGQTKTVEYSLTLNTLQYFEARFVKLNEEQAISVVRDITEKTLSQQTIINLSIMDAPTNVFNRNYFEKQMEMLRLGPLEGISFLMVDFDGLKLVNDTLGHATGDYYLKTVAELLKKEFVEAEFVARIGGDEFVVVLKDWPEHTVLNAKLAIKEAIDALNDGSNMIPFSISIGFSTYGPTASTIEDLIKTADDFMYREKLFHRQSTKSKNIEMLNTMLEERDFITQGHGDRMSTLIVDLAKALNTADTDIEALTLFAHFHDIGKIGISDSILFKPAKLTDKEFTEMKRHTEIGFRIAESSPDLMHISEWIYKHHEWWDGSGYPFGLSGEEIPLACRILSLIDAYDAMTNDRPYRKAMTEQAAEAELKRCSGTQFDPHLVEVFIGINHKRS